jgi:type II secretory pathway component PulF
VSELPKPEESPHRELVGCDPSGEQVASALPPEADVPQVEARLRAAGGRLTAVLLTGPKRVRPAGVSAEDFARFNELLGAAVRRGVPMTDGIKRLAREFGRGRFQTSLEKVAQALASGVPLRQAFARERTGFPALYGWMMEAGAASGRLSTSLLAFSRNIRTEVLFRRGIVEACVYPIVLLLTCCGLLAAFSAHILPRYEEVAPSVSITIPWFTRLTCTTDVTRQIFLLAACLIIAALLLLLLGIEPMMRRLPFIRSLYEAALWSSAADMLALLVQAEVPAPTALRLVGPATGSRWLCETLDRLAEAAEKGQPLSVAGREDRDVPAHFNSALDVGERRGDLATAMSDLAVRYRREALRRSQFLVRYLPPALAVVFGIIVFLMAFCVLGPFYKFWGGSW